MKKLSEFAAILSTNELFSKLEIETLERISKVCSRRRLVSGEVLFKKGDQGDALYGIRRGTIRIETGTADGKRLTLNMLGSGDVFGEIALLDAQPRTADAIAAEDCELLVLRKRDFLDFIEREPVVAVRLFEVLCQRLRWMSNRIEELGLLSLSVRMARRLAGLAQDFGNELTITQAELSDFVGAARENVSRQLQIWRASKIVELRRGRIVILDSKKLAAEANKASKQIGRDLSL